MAAAGVPLRTIQHWMGHADAKTTQVYAQYQPAEAEAEWSTRRLGDLPTTRWRACHRPSAAPTERSGRLSRALPHNGVLFLDKISVRSTRPSLESASPSGASSSREDRSEGATAFRAKRNSAACRAQDGHRMMAALSAHAPGDPTARAGSPRQSASRSNAQQSPTGPPTLAHGGTSGVNVAYSDISSLVVLMEPNGLRGPDV